MSAKVIRGLGYILLASGGLLIVFGYVVGVANGGFGQRQAALNWMAGFFTLAPAGALIALADWMTKRSQGRKAPATKIDVGDVLDKYIAAMQTPGNTVIRDASELPYPKEVIKIVLRSSIEMLQPSDSNKELLKAAYLYLADYQTLTNEERKAVNALEDVGDIANATDEAVKARAALITSSSHMHDAVMKRHKAEWDMLSRELKAL